MKSRLKISLTAGAALSLFAIPALAQQNGNPVPQITFPKSSSQTGTTKGGVHTQVPKAETQFNNGASGGTAGGAANASGGAGSTGGAASASTGASGGASASGGTLNVGQKPTGSVTGSINNNQNNTAGGVAVRHPITGRQINNILGMNVLNNKGAQIGTVSNLVVDKKHLAYAVIDVGGGFLGLGDHKIAVPVSKLTLQSNPAVLHTSLTQHQLQQLPTYQARNYTKYQGGNGNAGNNGAASAGNNNGNGGVFGANGGGAGGAGGAGGGGGVGGGGNNP